MKKARFTEEQMVKILRDADRLPVAEVAKKHVVSDVISTPGESDSVSWKRLT